MKKLVVTALAVLSCGAAYALPVGNPGEASMLRDGILFCGDCYDDPYCCDPCTSWCDALSLRMGFYGDYVFNHHVEASQSPHPDYDKVSMYTNAGYLALNACNRFDIFATLGATKYIEDTNSGGDSTSERVLIEAGTDFSWSVGARATLWECGCWTLGAEGQYFRADLPVTRVTFGENASGYPSGIDINYEEWQVGVGIAYRIWNFVPYAAVKYSDICTDPDSEFFTVLSSMGNFDTSVSGNESDDHWGYAIGVSLIDCERAAVTAEGRFGNEAALYVNGQFRF